MTLTENLDTFLADFGVTVSSGAITGVGVLDEPDQVIGSVTLSTEYSILCKYSVFGGLNYGDAITVDGTNYQVRDVRKVDDGVFCRVSLQKT